MTQNWLDKYNQRSKDENTTSSADDFDLFMELSEYSQEINTDQAWNKISPHLHKPSVFNTALLIRIAAMIVIAMGIVFVVLETNNVNPPSQTIVVSKDQVKAYTLPDGSVVTLAPGATIQYKATDFSKSRSLNLKGEAYFEVVKNNVPFTVSSKIGDVRVLGTTFNLNTAGQLDLYVNSGKVKMMTGQDQRVVTAGYTAQSDGSGQIRVEKSIRNNLISWKTGHFIFENQSLQSIIPYLEKHYQVKITASKAISNCKVTGEFNELPLKNVVTIIATILNAESEIQGNKVKFSGQGCN